LRNHAWQQWPASRRASRRANATAFVLTFVSVVVAWGVLPRDASHRDFVLSRNG